MLRRYAILIAAFLATSAPAAAQSYLREELRIPYPAAGARGLEAVMVRPAEPGRYPLALISHGSPRKAEDRATMTPLALLPQATEFARRGYAALIVMRRGFGDSGGGFAEAAGACNNSNYISASRQAAADLAAAIAFAGKRPDIDAAHILAAGVSAGGFASLALAANAPKGLVAAVNFAGGRGSRADDEVCQEDRLVLAFRNFGKRARVPTLWVYAVNDHFFGPTLARKMKAAYAAGGGKVEFVAAPEFGKDGHMLFGNGRAELWAPYVDNFLKANALALRAEPLPLPAPPNIAAPVGLNARGREAFDEFLRAGPHKAFAVSAQGNFGWRSRRRSVDEAKKGALEFCQKTGRECRIVVTDDTPAQ